MLVAVVERKPFGWQGTALADRKNCAAQACRPRCDQALAHLLAQSSGRHRGDGLLRRADGDVPLAYAWFAIDHARRRILHCDATDAPTAAWVVQQLRETFGLAVMPRHLIFDCDSIFSRQVVSTVTSFGIEPTRTACRSPWQNGVAERWVGTVLRELLDHVIVWNERHLRRLLQEYVA
jgi:hypothetical protein